MHRCATSCPESPVAADNARILDVQSHSLVSQAHCRKRTARRNPQFYWIYLSASTTNRQPWSQSKSQDEPVPASIQLHPQAAEFVRLDRYQRRGRPTERKRHRNQGHIWIVDPVSDRTASQAPGTLPRRPHYRLPARHLTGSACSTESRLRLSVVRSLQTRGLLERPGSCHPVDLQL